MIYWTDVTTQGSMIRRMHLNGSDVQVRPSPRPAAIQGPSPGGALYSKAVSLLPPPIHLPQSFPSLSREACVTAGPRLSPFLLLFA